MCLKKRLTQESAEKGNEQGSLQTRGKENPVKIFGVCHVWRREGRCHTCGFRLLLRLIQDRTRLTFGVCCLLSLGDTRGRLTSVWYWPADTGCRGTRASTPHAGSPAWPATDWLFTGVTLDFVVFFQHWSSGFYKLSPSKWINTISCGFLELL